MTTYREKANQFELEAAAEAAPAELIRVRVYRDAAGEVVREEVTSVVPPVGTRAWWVWLARSAWDNAST